MILKKSRSYIIMLKASAAQGRGQYSDVIDMSLKALELNPKASQAFTLLGGGYLHLKKYREAKEFLGRALKEYPDNAQLNFSMYTAIIRNGEPVDRAISYLKAYLKHESRKRIQFPFYLKIFFKIRGVKLDVDEFSARIDASSRKQYEWARKTVARYDREKSN